MIGKKYRGIREKINNLKYEKKKKTRQFINSY